MARPGSLGFTRNGMFDDLVMRSPGEATISWGWHTAAVCRGWCVHKTKDGRWSLEATLAQADPFKLQQRPLLFNAPRKGGYWCWPVQAVTVGTTHVMAQLGPPEY